VDLTRLCQQLKQEPLLHLSLGSKELFHSNLLGWMCQQFPAESVRVLAPWMRQDPSCEEFKIQREHRHLDLVVRLPGYAPLVVENKMFSLPDESQLRSYLKAVGAITPEPSLLLISLADPCSPDDRLDIDGSTWRYAPWRDLAQRLRAEFGDHPRFEDQMLAHEAHLLTLLDQVVQELSIRSPKDPFMLPDTTIRQLHDARIAAAIGKIRMYQVMHRIRDQYATHDLHPNKTEVNFTNGTPLMSSYWNADTTGNSVGWQCQGKQWRLAMTLKTMSGKNRTDERAAYAATQSSWFNFTHLCRILKAADDQLRPAQSKTLANGFNKYNPDFVYQYRLLPTYTTVGQVVEAALAYAHESAAWKFNPPPPGSDQ
jgi:hypothetical protein